MPAPAPVAVEQWGLEWEDLENLEFEVDGEAVRLLDGQAAVSSAGASEDRYTLQNRVTQGDLNGDGHDDVVAHIVMASAGTGVFHLLVPVIDDGQGGAARHPVLLGDRVVVEGIEVHDAMVEVSMLDRTPEESFTVISLRKTLAIDFSGPAPSVLVRRSEPLVSLPQPGPELAAVDIRFDPGAIGAIVAGSIEFRQRQAYTVHIAEGQVFTATLDAPLGLWLEVRLGDHVLVSGSQKRQQVQAELPATGLWEVEVISTHAEPAPYRLSIEALPFGVSPTPVPQPLPSGTPDEPAPAAGAVSDRSSQDGVPVIYLTFDDGPHPVHTPQVLEVLARHSAKATFFVVGSLVETYPRTVQRIVDEGHTLANHTWNHENLAGLPREAFDDTVGRTQALLGSRGTDCLRPPYGSTDAFTREWAAELGLEVQTWDFSPEDWLQPPAEEIAQGLIDNARDGAVFLLHDGGGPRTQTVLGLDTALQALTGLGYRFEPLCV